MRASFTTCFILIVLSGLALAQPSSVAGPFRVIVNPTNPTRGVTLDFLADAFLKKRTQWAHGELIRPVDLPRESSVRRRFTSVVLRRSVPAVAAYWQQVLFSGRGLPPVELSNEEDIVRYVLRNRGAIGYVSNTIDVHGVKVVPVQ